MAKKDASETKKIAVNEPPPIPRESIFGKKASIFSSGGVQNKGFSGTRFTPPQIRITQNKGGGGK